MIRLRAKDKAEASVFMKPKTDDGMKIDGNWKF